MSGVAYRRWLRKMQPPRIERVIKKKKKKKIKFTSHLAATIDTMMEARRLRLAHRREEGPKQGGEDTVGCLGLR